MIVFLTKSQLFCHILAKKQRSLTFLVHIGHNSPEVYPGAPEHGPHFVLDYTPVSGFVVSGMKGLLKPDPIISPEVIVENELEVIKKPDPIVSSSATTVTITSQEME